MEEFSERFDGQVINSLMDCLAGYKQVALGTESRDIIAIETEQRLMCFTVLQQGGTNNVAMSLQKKKLLGWGSWGLHKDGDGPYGSTSRLKIRRLVLFLRPEPNTYPGFGDRRRGGERVS